MTTYLTIDGERFFADTAPQLVRMLREASFVPSDNDKEFMREVAERAKLQNHESNISTDSMEAFVEDLIKAGFLKRSADK